MGAAEDMVNMAGMKDMMNIDIQVKDLKREEEAHVIKYRVVSLAFVTPLLI